MNCILVSNYNEIQMYDSKSWQEVKDRAIKVKLMEDRGRYKNQIIAMALCPYEKYLGVITGQNQITEQKPNKLWIYKMSQSEGSDADNYESFSLRGEPHLLRDNPQFEGICMDFVFKNNKIS
jgi:hypothetical protein